MILRVVSILIVSFYMMSSCMKVPDLTQDDGPEVDVAAVQNTLVDAWGDDDPTTINAAEFSYTEKDMTISSFPARVDLTQGVTVDTVQNSTSKKIYRLLFNVLEIQDDNNQAQSCSALNLCLDKDNTQACENSTQDADGSGTAVQGGNCTNLSQTASQMVMTRQALISKAWAQDQSRNPLRKLNSDSVHPMSNTLAFGRDYIIYLLGICIPPAGQEVHCHNLSYTQETVPAPPPPPGSPAPDCVAHPKDCTWTKNVVSFDVVTDMKDEYGNKIHSKTPITVKISPDAPYLSRLTDFCYQGLASSNGNSIPVQFCQRIKRFLRGTP